jgi:gamma-glutamyl:cysteine ligase YbdK (ATP-grasp superfamily)
MNHLRFHNGTIWRWNRPLIGFDFDGQMHLRIEHRVIPAGPTLMDCLANAALYYGLVYHLAEQFDEYPSNLPFDQAKANFYSAAEHGLEAELTWIDGARYNARRLVLEHLLPGAAAALRDLRLPTSEVERFLSIIEHRVASGSTGAAWQRAWVQRHGLDMRGLVKDYIARQQTDEPVHTWTI